MSGQPADAASVYLHIGEPKTGTTYLQQILWANRDCLLENGVLVPGRRPVDHWAAAQDLRGIEPPPNDPFGPVHGAWDRLAAEAARAPRAAVISHELFAAVDADQAARAARSFRSVDLHVVLTVRDIASLLPAEWQETVKHRNTRGWQDWLSDVIDRESPSPARRQWLFWRVHDTLEILRLWSTVVSAERVHVVTVPRSREDPHLLWHRFRQVIGSPPDVADPSVTLRNASLTLPQVEFLRRFNAALPERVPDWLYMRSIKDGLAHEAFPSRSQGEQDYLYLPADREQWARDHAESVVAGLRDCAYDVVGDLDELLPAQLPALRPDPATLADSELLTAALDAAVALTVQLADSLGVPLEQPSDAAPDAPPGGVKRWLIQLSQRHPAVHRLRRRYWDVANSVRRIRRGDRWRAVEDRNIT